jgi:phosphopantothenoylcysteine decarboxylase/phosphopantothenate--cysteine ligase
MQILVTAGPTREIIDPVRFISNRSSGRMGYAVAEAAAARGHATTLVSGPVALAAPAGVRVVRVVSAAEMLAAVVEEFHRADALVMAAAVADFRPRVVSPLKFKKSAAPRVIELEPTEDILSALLPAKQGRIVVGFAAETGDPVAEAARKRETKGADMIVANDVSEPGSGFDVETNRVTFVEAGRTTPLPLMSKRDVADRVVEWIETKVRNRGATGLK